MITNLLTAILLLPAQADTARFAQGIEYQIEARLDETTDVLHGRAELRYTNNSPVPLDTLWLHQHLNAFRPNSAWAQRELEYDEERFQILGPDEHAFDRFVSVEIDGEPVEVIYPLAPDSTVAGLPLPTPLEPGGAAVVRFDWTARLSTTPRRQGREGRRYDFAQWYPRIAAYTRDGWQTQPLMPQGEFFGEFGTYDVTLDVAEDQVIGATGVPVEGDPGWQARAREGYDRIVENRDAYPGAAAPDLGLLSDRAEPGRKHVRWRAEDVHHFAWSANPSFIYEGGVVERTGSEGGPIGVHVLYLPDDDDWADGVALRRTERALEWLQEMFGPYPWQQLTNLHRIESGGTEFPMMLMDGSPSEGLIVHEGTHQYLHGILANNEFAEGWLDEGFTEFMTSWYFEEDGATDVWEGTLEAMRQWEQAGRTEPIALPGAAFRDPSTYSAMTYAKTAVVLRMLRWLIGEESMREVLRTYYERHALQHVDEADFRQTVADVAGEDLDWFFDQWLHTTDQLDYGISGATAVPGADGSWTTRVEVGRTGEAWMPVTLRVGDEEQRLTSREQQQVVEVVTDSRPAVAVLDPENVLLDLDVTNNTREVQ